MAKARAIIKRRKSVQNIRKITRTMELIATARFKKALDRATEAEAYTRKIAEIVADLGATGASVSHPLLAKHDPVKNERLLILTSNRGLAGGYNGNVLRAATQAYQAASTDGIDVTFDIVGKRGITYARFRGYKPESTHTTFEDRPQFAEVEAIANQYIALYTSGQIDRLDVAYTRFVSSSRQVATVQTLLPMTADSAAEGVGPKKDATPAQASTRSGEKTPYEFLPDAASILEEIVPVSFKVRLFKCFLDAAVSEQIARMTAMRGATENADDMIKSYTRLYNRARQAQITGELAEIIGGAAALE
jgi:F-type H+-transporting ATPase subunit gamma